MSERRVACYCRPCGRKLGPHEELSIGGHHRAACDMCGYAFHDFEQADHVWTTPLTITSTARTYVLPDDDAAPAVVLP